MTEEWLKEENLKKNFSKIYELIDEDKNFLEICTKEKKSEYPEELGIFKKIAEENEFKKVLIIPTGREKEFPPGAFPLNFLVILEKNLRHFQELRNVDLNFAKKDWHYLLK